MNFKRLGGLIALATILACALTPVAVIADGWYGQFMRDGAYNLNVNCKVGCNSTTPLQAVDIQDKTSATPAPVNAPNGENVGLWNNSQLQVKHSGLGMDSVETCPFSNTGNSDNGAICTGTWGQEVDLATNVSASANQSWTQQFGGGNGKHGNTEVVLCMSASAATTFTVQESIDGSIFYDASIFGTQTDAKFTTTGAGSLCEAITPVGSNVKVTTSAAATVSVQMEAKY